MAYQVLIPATIPLHLVFGALGLAAVTLATEFFRPKARKMVTRTSIFCSIPFILYISTAMPAPWFSEPWARINYGGFIGLVICSVAVLNLTRRTKGFKFNPLDFLIFIVIILLPNLPSAHMESPDLKIMIAKALILIFGYDVLLGELRDDNKYLNAGFYAVLSIVVVRGLLL